MEIQFEKSTLDCLANAAWEVKTVEQTQEVRLTDAMGDIGKVLGCWGQVLLRGKEWRGSSMGVNGGVMVWVLYAPEDGGEVQSVETWVPFSMKWDFPEADRDGYMNVKCLLRCADARTLSARKLMVRVGVSAMGQAMVPVQAELASPGELPEDVQLLRRSYPVKLPREAGEKPFQLEETLPAPPMDRIIRYSFAPNVSDQKVMAGKVVFRGNGQLHVLYRDEDGMMKSWDGEVPFSQFADLEREYDDTAAVSLTPEVTNLELDMDENGLQLKAGLTAQYIVCDRPLVEVVEDAYSPRRDVAVKMEELQLPMVLDQHSEPLRLEESLSGLGQVVDVSCVTEHPALRRGTDEVQLEVPAVFQVLRQDGDGSLQSDTVKTQQNIVLPVDENSRIYADCSLNAQPQAVGGGVHADGQVSVTATAGQGLRMVTGLTVGEKRDSDPDRPSLILRRAGGEQLWDLAKAFGSTMDAIRKANQLNADPEPGKMLLIPVL